MMHCSKRMRVAAPVPVTSTTCGLTKRPVPAHLDLALLGQHAQTAVSFVTTDVFQARSCGRSMLGAPKDMPCALIASASSMTLRRAAGPSMECSRR